MAVETGCTCWQLPGPDGQKRGVAWLNMHERVTVTTTDGWVAEGTSSVGLAGTVEVTGPVLVVRRDDGMASWCEPEDVASARPTLPADALAVIQSVASALSDPSSVPRPGVQLALVVGDHERVVIRVSHEHVECQPRA